MITRVARRIVDANQDLSLMRSQTWTVVVVDGDEANAFVIPVCAHFCILFLVPPCQLQHVTQPPKSTLPAYTLYTSVTKVHTTCLYFVHLSHQSAHYLPILCTPQSPKCTLPACTLYTSCLYFVDVDCCSLTSLSTGWFLLNVQILLQWSTTFYIIRSVHLGGDVWS